MKPWILPEEIENYRIQTLKDLQALRKVCVACERVAKPHPTNAYGDLGGWHNSVRGWFCPDCPVAR
jgi:hypothetical protein